MSGVDQQIMKCWNLAASEEQRLKISLTGIGKQLEG